MNIKTKLKLKKRFFGYLYGKMEQNEASGVSQRIADDFELFFHERTEHQKDLENQIKAWKETCEILGNSKTLESLRKSIEEIKAGKFIPLKRLKSADKTGRKSK